MESGKIGVGLASPLHDLKLGVSRPLPEASSVAKPDLVRAANKSAQPPLAKPSSTALQKAVDKANNVLENKPSNEMHFSIAEGTGLEVVKMVDKTTGKTIIQFPSETMIEIAKSIDQVTGAIIKTQA